MDHKTKFQNQIEEIIFDDPEHTEDVDRAIDSLEDEPSDEEVVEQPNLQELAVYEHRESRVQPVDEHPSDVVDDYHYSRDTLYGLIERGKTALEGSLMVAKESEHPRAYEVTSTIMKNLSDMTKQLMEVSEGMAKAEKPSGGKKDAPTQNTQINNHFYGDKSVDDVLEDLDDDE